MEQHENFPFPFPPYAIQHDFMNCLYECLDKGNLGIFESPTGTGKTMSIICGAVKWLLNYEKKNEEILLKRKIELDEIIKELERDSGRDWFSNQTKKNSINEEKRVILNQLEAIEHRAQRKRRLIRIRDAKMEKVNEDESSQSMQSIRYENVKKKEKHSLEGASQILNDGSDSIHNLLLEDFELNSDNSDEDDENVEDMKYTKLFFCSRTHSQLTQFISEFKKSPYADQISLVPLASRQSYCINNNVKQLENINSINEKCLDLQKSKKTTFKKEKDLKKSKTMEGCPYNVGNQNKLIANIITRIHDIEEIVVKAKEMKTCPYYASRKSLLDGQVVVVPYNTILHENTRISSGIDLKNNIIIIDEAHNILESIEQMHSTTVTGRNILHCYNQLMQYHKRFGNLFSAKNLLYLNQLNFCLRKLLRILGGTTKSLTTDKVKIDAESKIYTIQDFETNAEIDTVNIFGLIKFIKVSKLIRKLQAYLDESNENFKVHSILNQNEKEPAGVSAYLNMLKMEGNANNSSDKTTEMNINIDEKNKTKSPLQCITSFLESLKSSCSDGRIVVIPGCTVGQGIIRFLLMNPAAHFHDIVKEARSVILAGGTMAPVSEFRDQLFIGAGAQPERIQVFSCDHVVPKENIITKIITMGPNRVPLDFTYHNRNNESLLNELGRTLVNLTNIIPGGIVVFFPSYNYEDTVYRYLEKSGVISKINLKKRVFREPKSASSINLVLRDYSESITNSNGLQTGSLLFSVVGGKLSEGLNFTDDLGRCIIVVGMPYPNIKSPELHEKMNYLDKNVRLGAGNEYYENSCMKAVNQCIGRAVRHINDYATVILLDRRFPNKIESLPGWIQRTLTIHDKFNVTVRDVADFFLKKKKKI